MIGSAAALGFALGLWRRYRQVLRLGTALVAFSLCVAPAAATSSRAGMVVTVERIVIVGPRGLSPAETEELYAWMTMLEVGMMVSITMFDHFSTEELVRVVSVTACGNPRVTEASYRTTSHDDEFSRVLDANQIIRATLGAAPVLRPVNIAVMYSDGGTQVIRYASVPSISLSFPGP